jgi:hypothetical protein
VATPDNLSGLADKRVTVPASMSLIEDVQRALTISRNTWKYGPYTLYVPRSNYINYPTAHLKRTLRDKTTARGLKCIMWGELVYRRTH